MAEKVQHMFRIERVVEPGELKNRLIAGFRELRWARRMWASIVWHEWETCLVRRHGARI